jgi:spoIIIJ-associated protein
MAKILLLLSILINRESSKILFSFTSIKLSVRNGGSRNYSNKRRNNSRNISSRKPNKSGYKKQYDSKKPRVEADKDEQLKVSIDFLKGLVKSFGLKGDVEGSLEDDNLVVKVTGEQTEALVGDKGFIIRSLHELTRTVVQRKTGAGTRLRLDVADYALKRKEALTIYAERLSKQIKEDKQEVMLEPMNSVDRKTLHDAAANFDGIKSYSEGREPYRSVVFAPEEEE